MPTNRLLGLIVGLLLVCGSVTAGAVAALGGGGPVPPPKPLAAAVHDALAAPASDGVTATISFTNNLIDSSSIQGANPLLTGASGRLWASHDGHLRLELQSSRGDAQILLTPDSFALYDQTDNTVYRGSLPKHSGKSQPAHDVPTVAKIQDELTRLMQHFGISAATPTDIGGAAAYSVTISPKHSGGLLGSAQLAWDAVHGIPLRVAIYAHGNSSPVLELTATHVQFGAVSPSVFDVPPPKGAKIVELKGPDTAHATRHGKARLRTGLAAVAGALPFKLDAPAALAGLPRTSVKLLDWGGHPAALVTSGRHLGAILVVERPRDASRQPSKRSESLPTLSINGTSGTELATALGTLLQFDRGAVSYVVAGSVPPAAAEAAARGL
jgi:outer membrane lipoprotein-sorting protein